MKDPILRDVQEHLRRTGEAPTTFGENSCKDRHIVTKLRGGLEPRRKKRTAILKYITKAKS